MQGILDVYALFSSYVSRDTMKNWENGSTYGENTAIDLSNRYFSSVKKASTGKCVAFDKDVDPYGILTGLESAQHVHCENNVVEYYERIQKASGTTR